MKILVREPKIDKDLETDGDWQTGYMEGIKNTKFIYESCIKEVDSKVITLCGSSRFCDIMAVCAWLLEREEGAITMGLHYLPQWYTPYAIDSHLAEVEGVSEKMDILHMKKIDISNEIFVVNWENYIGSSTTNETNYAKSQDKKIRYITEDYIGDIVKSIIMLNCKPK